MVDQHLRVMQSFGVPRATTNPYITMLDEELAATAGVTHLRFSWGGALFGNYDAFHWHWPEGKLHGSTWWKAAGKYVLTTLISLRHRISRRIAVVRTVHNLHLPDDNAVRLWLLRRIDAQTDHRIMLNTTTPVAPDQASTLILHGHYGDWYSSQPRVERLPGRIGTFGGVRRYKSLLGLLEAYRGAVEQEPHLTLRIGGRPSTPELAQELQSQAADLPGVHLTLEFLSDAELAELATSSELIVFAYQFMHNSGAVLAALSFSRPVLVPRNEANEALAAEVGAEWVLMYDGELDHDALLGAWRRAAAHRREHPHAVPDLSRREWSDAGVQHAHAYQVAVGAKRGRRELQRVG